MNLNLPVLNRAFERPADGFYHVVPMGEFPGRRGDEEVVQVIDGPALSGMARNFEQDARELLVDFEHDSLDTKKSSVAAGWIKEMQVRSDGLWARIDWTDLGDASLSNGRLRLVSPVFDGRDLIPIGGNRVRPVRLHSIGLTNSPNMRGMVPLSNKASSHENGAALLSPAEAVRAITELVAQLKPQFGGDFQRTWNEVQRRAPELFAAMSSSQATAGPADRHRSAEASAEELRNRNRALAGEVVRNRTAGLQRERGVSFERAWPMVMAQNKRSAEVMKTGDFGALSDLEAEAHQYYLHRVSRGDIGFDRYKGMKQNEGFFKLVTEFHRLFPDLGYEGVWGKIKETAPESFWHFVADFEVAQSLQEMFKPTKEQLDRAERIASGPRRELFRDGSEIIWS